MTSEIPNTRHDAPTIGEWVDFRDMSAQEVLELATDPARYSEAVDYSLGRLPTDDFEKAYEVYGGMAASEVENDRWDVIQLMDKLLKPVDARHTDERQQAVDLWVKLLLDESLSVQQEANLKLHDVIVEGTIAAGAIAHLVSDFADAACRQINVVRYRRNQ